MNNSLFLRESRRWVSVLCTLVVWAFAATLRGVDVTVAVDGNFEISAFATNGPYSITLNGQTTKSLCYVSGFPSCKKACVMTVPLEQDLPYRCLVEIPAGSTWCGAGTNLGRTVAFIVSGCFDVYVDGVKTNRYTNLKSVSGDSCEIVIRPRKISFTWDCEKRDNRYTLPADGHSRATPSCVDADPASYTWSFVGDSLGCIKTNKGVIIAGTNTGTIRVQATWGGVCYEESLDLVDPECSICEDSTCAIGSKLGSVNVQRPMGWSVHGNGAGFLQLKEASPGLALAQASKLRYAFLRSDVEEIFTNGATRQVKAPHVFVNVVSNSSSQYTIELYRLTNVLPKGAGGLYVLTNSPFATTLVESPGGDTNKLRVTETREGTQTTFDYQWVTNGWELLSGDGLRKETKTVVWSETNTLKTVTVTVQDGAGTTVFPKVEQYRKYACGERLISEVTGSGGTALTNTYTYTASGFLEQAVRADGSWEFYRYDSSNRPTNIFSAFGNQGVTTNRSLCRLIEHTYTNTVVSGSGDNVRLEFMRPRRTIQYLLGQEVSRSYFVATNDLRKHVHCVTPGAAWTNADNLVTTTRLYTNGFHHNEPFSLQRPDGTIEIFNYSTYPTNATNTVLAGHPDATGTNIDQGTQTISVFENGKLLSKTTTDVPSGIVLAQGTFQYDSLNRLTNITYLDGTSTARTYDCCGVSSETDRDGTLTSYTYDALKRVLTTTRAGVTLSNVYDAEGNLLSTVRHPSTGSPISTASATFDDAGRLTSRTDAMNHTTSYTNCVDGSGQTVQQITHPNTATQVETRYRDRSLASLTGTAVHGKRTEYGVESEGGTQRAFRKEIKLATDGSETSEWVKTYLDMLGRPYKVVYPDGAASQTFYSINGQVAKVMDPDGVTTLYTYNALGEEEYAVLDVNTNGQVDLSGPDRVLQTQRFATTVNGIDVRVVQTYAWPGDGSSASNLVSETCVSTDGRTNWTTRFGLMTETATVYGGSGYRYVTNTAPDGTQTLETFLYGRRTSLETRHPDLGTLTSASYSYDGHGRLVLVTDARTGTTTNWFDDADRLTTVSTAPPGDGSPAQVTWFDYDSVGQVTNTVPPDGAAVNTRYWLTGEVATNSGARTYPAAYTYDYAGRVKTLTTWTDYADGTGAAVTTWNYDSQRGWLTGKQYADNNGPSYTYTQAGRLATRTWARGVTTTCAYSPAGDLNSIDYSDSTPDVTFAYDRLGRQTTNTQGSVTTTRNLDLAGNLLREAYTGGPLDGLAVTNAADAFLRRTNLALTYSSSLLTSTFYSHDAASRLATVSDRTNLVAYAYLTNSPLVERLYFTNAGVLCLITSKSYDNLNRLTETTSATGGVAMVQFAYTHNAANQRTRVTQAGDTHWDYAYDTLGQVTAAKRFWPEGDVVAGQQFEYTYDDIGNRKTAASGGNAWGANLRYENYTANHLNQYTRRTVPGSVDLIGHAHTNATVTVHVEGTNGPAAIINTWRRRDYFRADVPLNNTGGAVWASLTNVAVLQNGTNDDLIATVSGRMFLPQTPEEFHHDADGNLTNDGRWNLTWDGENRLIRMVSRTDTPTNAWLALDFGYDAQGRRISKVVSNWTGNGWARITDLRFVYDAWNLIGEVGTSGSLVRSYTWGLDLSGTIGGAGGVGGLLWVFDSSSLSNQPSTHFPAFDGNGNLETLLNASDGTVSADYRYSPYGTLLRATGPMAEANPFRFSTKYQDDETDLLYYGHRYRAATLAGWLNRDRTAEGGGLNLYGFVGNNAQGRVDPLGDEPVWIHDTRAGFTGVVDSYDIHYLGYQAAIRGQQVDRGSVLALPLRQQPLGALAGESLEMVFGEVPSAFMEATAALAPGLVLAPVLAPYDIANAFAEAGRQSVSGDASARGFAYARAGVSFVQGVLVYLPIVGPVSKCASPAKSPNRIARITSGSLPAAEEASLLQTLGHIDAGTRPTGATAVKWGTPFENRPPPGSTVPALPGPSGVGSPYMEYRVAPGPGTSGAGPLRIVVNQQTGEMYYTWTHYGDAGAPAFVKIR